jgi:hypothetical protein
MLVTLRYYTSFADGATAISLSNSQRSSLISNFSRLSSASSFSTYSQESVTTDGPHKNHETCQGLQRVSHAQETVSSPSVTTNTPLICFACSKHCSTQSALKRHQDEKCERRVDWTCPDCQWTGERLIRHYATSHGDQCRQCCSIPGERVCDDCRVRLSESYLTLPRIQTWGCPYCSAYFHDFDFWNKHCICHHQRGEAWSWPMMIWSLLQQFDLSRFGQYDWNVCDWSKLNEKTGPELRDDLQRLRLPKDVRRHQEYCELQIDEVLVRYTHGLVTVDPPLSDFAIPEPHQQVSASSMTLPRKQEVTYVKYRDMHFPVPPSFTDRLLTGLPNIGQEFQTQTLPLEMFFNAHHHQNHRPDSATIPHTVRLQGADTAHTPQSKLGGQFSRRTPIVTPISGDGPGNVPNGQSIESSGSNDRYAAPDSNADALQMLCHRSSSARGVDFKVRSGSQLPVLVEHCLSSEVSRTAPGRRNAEYQTEDVPVTPPQTRPMSDIIFQQYLSYPNSSPEPEP